MLICVDLYHAYQQHIQGILKASDQGLSWTEWSSMSIEGAGQNMCENTCENITTGRLHGCSVVFQFQPSSPHTWHSDTFCQREPKSSQVQFWGCVVGLCESSFGLT